MSDEDSDSEYTEFYRNHPSAVNKPYVPPELPPSPEEPPVEYVEVLQQTLTPFVPPSQRTDAPLATILNPQLDCVDPRRFFPDFDPNKILRFSRLFATNIKSSSKPEIWWMSKTFHKKPLSEEEKESHSKNRQHEKKLTLEVADRPPNDQLLMDEEVLLLRNTQSKERMSAAHKTDQMEDAAPWRFGPAKMWYDKVGIPVMAHSCDYGFKVKPKPREKEKEKGVEEKPNGDSSAAEATDDETFLPANLIHWEDEIVQDGDDIRAQVMNELRSGRPPSCGWIPTQNTRTYESFLHVLKTNGLDQLFARSSSRDSSQFGVASIVDGRSEPTASHSLFPLENTDLLNTSWEDDIIWDDQSVTSVPEPKLLTLDYLDDPVMFGMPEDRKGDERGPVEGDAGSQQKAFDRKEHQFTKKSKMILGQVQQRQKQEEEEQMESSIAQLTDKDPFNLSSDDYYLPKANTKSGTSLAAGMLIQHSIPAQNIHRTFFPTHLSPFKLRHWHRFPLSKRILKQIGGKYIPIFPLAKHIRKMSDQREKQKAAEGGGDIFFMREVADLSGRDGDLLLMEYSEEHPILLSQPGMASRIRNYHKRKTGKDTDPELEFGELAFAHNSPFLGQLAPGQTLQSVENNLFRAPLYRHEPRFYDFLLIRNKQGYFIRKCPALFVVGQQCPLYEVPSPNSKRATVFVRDFLLAFIYRLFWASTDKPRRLKMEDIKAAFPHYAESSVRKRLKQCSDFKRLGTGPDQNFWVLRADFRLPSKEEVLAMVTPEMCCAQYSMLAAEQRLKDAGYGEKYFFTPENEDDSDDQVTIEDEIKCAPWNTSRAFVASMRGKCLLDQTGIADPSGCGQGFSYVRVSNKPQKDDTPQVPKRLVTGTNADLRKLPLKEAKEICRDYGVKEEEINALSRWEIIDVIRTLSTQAAKQKSDFSVSGMARFARGNIRFNFADMQEKYKKHCQHVFDLQNCVLSNTEELSTDEGSSGDDSDNEELASRLESMLSAAKGKKNISDNEKERMEFENEEKERRDLQRMMHGETNKEQKGKEATEAEKKSAQKMGEEVADSASKISGLTANQKLKIYRTYKNPDGSESTRVEVITRPQLIEAYARIRMTKDDTFIQVYAQMDEQYKEERRKEKRRLQDQLRRIRRNELKVKSGAPPVEKKPVVIKPNLLRMRCSACHGTGHMKTNKNCPLYGKRGKTVGEIHPVAMTEEQMEHINVTGELIAVEGTKLKISKKIYQQTEQKKRDSVRLHIPRTLLEKTDEVDDDEQSMSQPVEDEEEESDMDTSTGSASRLTGAKRRTWTEDADYLAGPSKSVQRIRADPRVTLATQLTEIVNELKNIQGSEHLLQAVNPKKVKDYYDIVKKPMDLQSIKMKITDNKYELRKDFIMDVKQILENSILYNGINHIITEAARTMFDVACKRIMEKEQKLIKLEKQINPLLDENDRVGFSFILADIVQQCKNIPKSVPFHTKVDPRKAVGYYEKIDNPMDLGTIEKNVKEHGYSTVAAFLRDIEQILRNSELYNGPAEKSSYTSKAVEIFSLAKLLLEEKSIQLHELETNMNGGQVVDDDDEEEDYEGEGDGDGDIGEDMGDPNDDLMMSGDDEEVEEEGDEEVMGMDETEWTERLMQSNMHTSGQLNSDLALSESDDEEHLEGVKRQRMDDQLYDSF